VPAGATAAHAGRALPRADGEYPQRGQLFALGVIGEYLARVHVRLMDRPSYVIADSLGG